MDFDEVDCAIYVDAPGLELLMELLVEQTGGQRERDWTVEAEGLELYVDKNDEADSERRKEFPDGFLYFAREVEVYAHERPQIALVTRLLEAFWERGWPATASCDYEDKLPRKGGYKSPDIPWPGR